MQHNYTNSELDTAVGESYDITGDAPLLDVSFNGLRKFLDTLPEPQDDWVECEFEDIRKGDMVRMVQVGRTTDFHLPVIETHPTHLVLQDNTQCSNFHKAVYYRIPAPAQHPDPAVQRYIVDHDDNNMLYQSYVGVSTQEADHMYYSPQNYLGVAPENFTNWSEAVIKVPKEVADSENS